MKKFIILLCILMLIPISAFIESKSPSLVSVMIITEPEVNFELIDMVDEWPIIADCILTLKDFENFTLIDGVKIYIDQPYNIIKWQLSTPITKEQEPFMLVINSNETIKYDLEVTDDGWLITDFSDFDFGTYILCFYIKKDIE